MRIALQRFVYLLHLVVKLTEPRIMKKLLATALLSLSVFAASAQQKTLSAPVQNFKDYTAKLEKDRQEASGNKNYLRADTLLKQWVRQYDILPDSVKPQFKGWEPGMYYNIACYEALQGKKDAALNSFEKCVALGYSNYNNTIADTDLESLRKEKRYLNALQTLRERGDKAFILRQSGAYDRKVNKEIHAFTYQQASAPELIAFKTKYNLDSVAGKGDDITRMKNLLFWVHNAVRHDGNSNNPSSKNGTDLIEVCRKEDRGVNCRMMATILKDAYQAEGFKARMVTCMPKDTLDNDCHVINIVWSDKLNKWVWMDPTFNAYVADKSGNLLSIEEVRAKLHADKLNELVLNTDANWNNKNKQTKEYYLGYYMSKNLYWLQCSTKSEWNIETRTANKPVVDYVNLYPGGFTTLKAPKVSNRYSNTYTTNNPQLFWQKPVVNKDDKLAMMR
jgi:hypothetical protein